MATYVGRALRWQVLMAPVCEHPGFWNLLSGTLIGFTALCILGRPGELVRPYLIAVKEKVTLSSQLAAWLLERIYDLLMILLILGYSLTQILHAGLKLSPPLRWMLTTGGWSVAGIGGICLLFLLAVGKFSRSAEQRLADALTFLPERYRHRTNQMIHAFGTGIRATSSKGNVVKLTLYTLAEWLLIVGCNIMLFRSFPQTAHLQPVDSLVFVSLVSFGGIVQIPGIGGGMQVAAVLILTELYGFAFEEASGVAVLIWIATYFSVVPFGLVLGFREGLNWKKLRAIGTTGAGTNGEPYDGGVQT